MKTILFAALVALSGCGLTGYPKEDCGDGYVKFTNSTGTYSKCIKPGMKQGILPAHAPQ